MYANYQLTDGPVVLEVPPQEGAGLLGAIVDAWDEPVADVGPAGEDNGAGGRYLLLPPGYDGASPEGTIPVPFTTNNGYLLFRAIPDSSDEAAQARSLSLAKRVRLYSQSQADDPPPQRYIDLHDVTFDGILTFDDTFFDNRPG